METNTVWTFIIWVVPGALLLGIINQVLVRKWVNPSALHSPHSEHFTYLLGHCGHATANVSNTRHMVMVPWIFSLFNVLKMWKVWKKRLEPIHSYSKRKQLLGGFCWTETMGNANGFLWIKAIMNISIHNCLLRWQ